MNYRSLKWCVLRQLNESGPCERKEAVVEAVFISCDHGTNQPETRCCLRDCSQQEKGDFFLFAC